MKFLIVDDQPTCRMTLNFILKRLGHQTTLCADGLEAWDTLQKERFDVVFADWVMPGIDGLELCRRIREADHEHYVYVVLCTAKDTQADLVTAMKAGADDFSAKPVRPDEIEVRVRAAQRICDLQSKLKAQNQELEEKHQKLSEAYLRIETDLAAAAKVLEDLLPKSHPDTRLRTSYFFQPSHLLGGDFLNYFPLGEDILGFYLLDVAGHGIPASLKASTLSRILSPSDSLLWRDQERIEPRAPHEVARRLNRLFLDEDDYFTLIYGLFHTKELYLEFTQAGHPPPILVRNGRSRTVGRFRHRNFGSAAGRSSLLLFRRVDGSGILKRRAVRLGQAPGAPGGGRLTKPTRDHRAAPEGGRRLSIRRTSGRYLPFRSRDWLKPSPGEASSWLWAIGILTPMPRPRLLLWPRFSTPPTSYRGEPWPGCLARYRLRLDLFSRQPAWRNRPWWNIFDLYSSRS